LAVDDHDFVMCGGVLGIDVTRDAVIVDERR
jgi:hypothetical protein